MNYINAKSNTYPFVEVVIYSEIVRRSIFAVNQSRFYSAGYEFRSKRATNVVLPQPVGPATMHVKGCFQRGSMCVNEWLSGGASFYTSRGAVLRPSGSTLRFPYK